MQLHFRSSNWIAVLLTPLALVTTSIGQEPSTLHHGVHPMLDQDLIAAVSEGVTREMHRPEAREVVLVTNKPWEGNTSAYYTVFQDGDVYRMYYRGSHYDTETKQATHPEVTCYAESKDGIHWVKPSLGLYEYDGSKNNNIVWDGIGTHCFTPFLDTNPNGPKESRYKALSRGRPQAKAGLYAFHSADGIHWELTHPDPVITVGAFDSQNLAFWDPSREKYVAYYRHFQNGVRDIMTCESDDFVQWTEPEFLSYGDAPKEHLYTNAIRPYPNASHLWIGFPTRYNPRNSQVEPILMSSRNGKSFRRWAEPLIPHTAPEDRDGNRSNYMVNGLLTLPDDVSTWSMYATEAYYTGPDSRVRRFSIRRDGFVSLSAGAQSGTVTTIAFKCDANKIQLNYRTTDNGAVQVAVLDSQGAVIPGYEAEKSNSGGEPLQGDETVASLHWGDRSLRALRGKTIRLRFELHNSDLFAFTLGD